jgi:hypothetical protein
MRVQPIHARYTPFIQAAVERAIRECMQDAAVRVGDPDGPYKHIPDYRLDIAAEGQHWIITGASFEFVMESATLSGTALLDAQRRKNRGP